MALTKNTTTVTNISDLSSTPNETEGLTASQLQAKFDQTGSDLKDYINDTLTVEQDAINASKINITDIVDNLTSTDTNKPLSANQGKVLSAGWLPLGDVTYSSVDDPTGVVTIAEDATSYLSLGMRLKMTNGGNTIYGIITKIAYSSPNTTITFLHEIDPTDSLALHLLQNSAITNVYYSTVKAPFGFPMSADKWSVIKTYTSDTLKSSPGAGVWYNLGGVYLDIPIGYWGLEYKVTAQNGSSAATSQNRVISTTLSTTNNGTTNPEYNMQTAVVGNYIRNTFEKMEKKTFAAKTRVYLNTMSDTATGDNMYNLGAGKPTQIIAVCAYL